MGGRGAVMAWSGTVSAAAAGVAALFHGGRTPLDHVLSTGFTVIAIVAFLILLGTAVPRPPWSPPLTADGAARKLADRRAGQVRRVDILTSSGLTRAIAALSAYPDNELLWEPREQDRRDRSFLVYVGESNNGSMQLGKVRIHLYKSLRATDITASTDVEIRDIPAWLSARERLSDKGPCLPHNELIAYLSAAWHTAAEVLPALVVDDPVAVPPVRPPTMRMVLSVYPDHSTLSGCDIRDLTDFSPFNMRDERRLTDIIINICGPLYLSRDDRSRQIKEALIHLI